MRFQIFRKVLFLSIFVIIDSHQRTCLHYLKGKPNHEVIVIYILFQPTFLRWTNKKAICLLQECHPRFWIKNGSMKIHAEGGPLEGLQNYGKYQEHVSYKISRLWGETNKHYSTRSFFPVPICLDLKEK